MIVKGIRIALLVVGIVLASPYTLFLRFLDYASYGWFDVALKNIKEGE